MAITGKELAKIMNLSEAAVSLALNNKPGVSTKTRKKVIDTAKEYGYDFTELNWANEKSPTKGTVYLVIFRKHGTILSDTSFFSQLSEGVNYGCLMTGYYMNILNIYESDDIEAKMDELERQGCKGLILLGTEMQKEDLVQFQKTSMPLVLLDSYFSDIMIDCVHINNLRSAYLATNHLIKATSSHPGYLHSSYRIQNFYERKLGYNKAIQANGLSLSRSMVHRLSPTLEGAYGDMLAILENDEPLAECYFADNDLIAAGAMKAFKEKGIRVPEDIAVMGFDDIPLCTYVEPSLSSVHVPKRYMGEVAAKRLIDIINSEHHYPLKIEVEATVIARDSL